MKTIARGTAVVRADLGIKAGKSMTQARRSGRQGGRAGLAFALATVLTLGCQRNGESRKVAVDQTGLSDSDNAFIGSADMPADNWWPTYGRSGWSLVNGSAGNLGGTTVTPQGGSTWSWASGTEVPNACMEDGDPNKICAAHYDATSFDVDVDTGDTPRRIAVYMLDYDANDRSQRVELIVGGHTVDSRELSDFRDGKFFIYKIHGRVKLRFARLAGANAVVSGFLFDPVEGGADGPPPPPPPTGGAPGLSDRVLVVYNTASAAAVEVADHYTRRRAIPDGNRCPFHLPDSGRWGISLGEYDSIIKPAIRGCLERQGASRILYIVFSYETPFRLEDSRFAFGGFVSLDGVVSDIWEQLGPPTQRVFNPYSAFAHSGVGVYAPFRSLAEYRSDEGAKLVYSVWRLDAPTKELAKGLVDQAIDVEQGGLDGQACLDLRSDPTGQWDDGGYISGDWDLLRAAEMARTAGLPVTEDRRWEEFGTSPAPSRCDGAALYSGWYSYQNYNDAFGWARGAIGWHIDSASALSPRTENNWAGGALGRGIAVTTGAVNEPYLGGIPHPDQAFRNLFEGANVGDAIFRSTSFLHWMIINMGDPLYRPFPNGRPLASF
jgi:uncharacterized protein (TIGR03790 family)